MAKILFAPTTGREVVQFRLIKPELEKMPDNTVLALAVNDYRKAEFEKMRLPAKHIAEYKTKNMLKVIKNEKPDIVVTEFGFQTKGLIWAANYVGTPTLMIDDGVTSDYSSLRNMSKRQLLRKVVNWLKSKRKFSSLSYESATLWAITDPLRFPIKLTREICKFFHNEPSYITGLNIAVLSFFAKDSYLRMGVPPQKVFVTGLPRFDLIQHKRRRREQILAELGIARDKGIIVLATQPLVELLIWTEEERKRILEVTLDAVDGLPDKQLVIKLHPDENVATYQRILANVGGNRPIICRDMDVYDLLDACDLLIVAGHSTVALEAMILDKPVIIMNLYAKPDLMPYVESGAAIGVYKEEDLAPAINRALFDIPTRINLAQKRKRFVEKQVYKPDGQASKRVADLIMRLVAKSR